jgi:hypothetical protein
MDLIIPPAIYTKYLTDSAYQLFKRDPYHTSLHFKRIDPQASLYSVRVGAHYRAVGELEGDTIIWTWIGTHEEYNKL